MRRLALPLLFAAPLLSAEPAHYIVFELDDAGRPQPVFHAHVDLADAPGTARLAAALPKRGEATVRVRLHDGHGGAFTTEVALSRQVHGEFARDPERDDGRIVAVQAEAGHPAFVVRVPVAGSAGIGLELDGARYDFDLAELAAKAPQLALARQQPEVRVERVGGGGPPSNRVDLLVLGDGYTSGEQTTFDGHVAAIGNVLFGVSPYQEYAGFVNLTAGFVVSSQSGADHPPYQAGCTVSSCCADGAAQTDPRAGTFVSTALDGRFCTSQIHRLVTVNASKTFAAAAAYPNWDLIVVSLNDPVYGGSGGTFSVISAHNSAALVFVHELGHSFTKLADEYTTPYPGFPPCSDVSALADCEVNVTDQTAAASVKWKAWFTPGLAIPSPNGANGTGLFAGARYLSSGMYRPTDHQCLMRSLGTTFDPICRQEYVLRLYRGGFGVPTAGIDLIEPGTESPSASAPVTYVPGTTQVFSADVLQPGGGVTRQWLLDGVPVGTGASYAFSQAGGSPATRTLELRVIDPTPFVHPDLANGLTTHSRSWQIVVDAGTLFGNGFE